MKKQPLDKVISAIQTRFLPGENHVFTITATQPEVGSILSHLDLPQTDGEFSYLRLSMLDRLVNPYFGDLAWTDDLAVFGRFSYSEGLGVHADYAFRKGDEITVGFIDEICSITPQRTVDVKKTAERYSFMLPDVYDPMVLRSSLKDLPPTLVERDHYSIPLRNCVHFGEVLAGYFSSD
ncbi:hypothetical protein H6504_02555 [Candidatus Woesearchaeota archaeon]|nr:hypothetical protein [Candidatus Woesearchaeota archaeon]